MKYAFTIDEIIERVRKLAEQSPDFVYTRPVNIMGEEGSCSYIHEETGKLVPGCVMGHVFVGLGMSPEELHKYEGYLIKNLVDELVGRCERADELEKRLWLGKVQSEQDSGHSWSEAVGRADALYLS
jgi:hypothetical protein